jgi:hypothetical protein
MSLKQECGHLVIFTVVVLQLGTYHRHINYFLETQACLMSNEMVHTRPRSLDTSLYTHTKLERCSILQEELLIVLVIRR